MQLRHLLAPATAAAEMVICTTLCRHQLLCMPPAVLQSLGGHADVCLPCWPAYVLPGVCTIAPQKLCWSAHFVLCCAVLCCAVLCCAVLCCAVLCCAVLCCAVLCCAVLCCAVLTFVLSCSVDIVGICAGQAAAVGRLPAQHIGVQLAAVLSIQLCHGAEAGSGGAVHICRYSTCSTKSRLLN
jgi:hypothetical protein